MASPDSPVAASSEAAEVTFVDEASAGKSERIRHLLFGFKCRFYPKERPTEEELCMIKVRGAVIGSASR